MKRNRTITILILSSLLVLMCLFAAACGRDRIDGAKEDDAVAATTQTADEAVSEEAAAEDSEDAAASQDDAAEAEADKKDAEETAPKEKEAKKKTAKKKVTKAKSGNDSSKSSSGSNSSAQTKEKKKVWVEPVTETRTVTLDTGTRYCNGPNSNGGCGASWHGSKDGTYDKWYNHWQDYVKKRTKEEAEKGNTYVCDHIHDDSRWVPDTTTETVVVKEGYWKEVD